MEFGSLINKAPDYQFSFHKLPIDLQHSMGKAEVQHYGDLYEENAQDSLESACKEVLDSFYSSTVSQWHTHYIWMAILLGFATQSTIEAYLDHDSRPKAVIVLLLIQFEQARGTQLTQKLLKPDLANQITTALGQRWVRNYADNGHRVESKTHQTAGLSEVISTLFPKPSEGCQALDEGLDVFRNALKTLDPAQAQTALLDILDNCFQGYAIFPGSAGRRELFNWWLQEVVPATWFLQFPQYLYTIKGLQATQILLERFSWTEKDTDCLLGCFSSPAG